MRVTLTVGEWLGLRARRAQRGPRGAQSELPVETAENRLLRPPRSAAPSSQSRRDALLQKGRAEELVLQQLIHLQIIVSSLDTELCQVELVMKEVEMVMVEVETTYTYYLVLQCLYT